MNRLAIFIGFDAKETVAYHTLVQSIIAHSSKPIAITPIVLSHLTRIFNRERHPLQSTDFSFTRFLTPYLSNFQGTSLYMDCDMIVKCDIAQLFSLADDNFAIQCVKHQYEPKEKSKFLNQTQTQYDKKNWSSLMLMNNAKCKALTPHYVNTASGLELHQFKWLASDDLIGELPKEWNHLVGYDSFNTNAKIIHYTQGGPYFKEYQGCDYANDWHDMCMEMISPGCEKELVEV